MTKKPIPAMRKTGEEDWVPVRPDDWKRWVGPIHRAKTPEERERALLGQFLDMLLAAANVASGYSFKTGRPRGSSKLDVDDRRSIDWMRKTSAETGEARPYRLAGLCIDAGMAYLNGPSDDARKATKKRLAEKWKKWK